LYYVQGGTVLMSVSVSTGQGVALGQPQQLFQSGDLRSTNSPPTYDVSPDGQRFVTVSRVTSTERSEPEPPKIRIVGNWYEEFRDREQWKSSVLASEFPPSRVTSYKSESRQQPLETGRFDPLESPDRVTSSNSCRFNRSTQH